MLTVQDFLDASAFERSALAIVSPLVSPTADRSGFDLRSNTHNLVAQGIVAGPSSAEMLRELRPLFFGAAWKVLDLLMEFGLSQGQAQMRNLTIEKKKNHALTANVPPLSGDRDLWERVAKVYSSTVEARHCLIHRSFEVAPSGTMTRMFSRVGQPLSDITSTEQLAFCRLAQRCAFAVQSSALSKRNRLDLLWSLDELSAHHGLPRISNGEAADLPEVIKTNAIRVASGWVVDLVEAHEASRIRFPPGRPYYDLEIHFPDSGIPPMVGRLEDAPEEGEWPIDPENPPEWIDI